MEREVYPVRVNKYLVRLGLASRRKADELIKAGHVFVNGRKALVGQMIGATDTVTVSEEAATRSTARTYIAFNKPTGIVSHSPEPGQEEVLDFLPPLPDLAVIGRLDRNSHGLILASDDGLIVEKLLNPRYRHEKEYNVRVTKPVTASFIRALTQGVHIGAHTTRKCFAEKTDTYTFRIILTEGKKHQIRRMCDALGYAVADLTRVRIGSVQLQGLREGEYRTLAGKELEHFLRLISR